MDLRLIGSWTAPLNKESHGSLIIQAVKRSGGCCAFCGIKMPMTVTHPHGGLSVCVRESDISVELDNLVTLCAFCVNFNDIHNLCGLGSFVELPWLSQSDLNNFLRIVYCVQTSNDPYVKSTFIYQGSNAILESLSRTPKAWESFYFDGSVEKIIHAMEGRMGFFDKRMSSEILYIDRLRFFFHPAPFKDDIEFWRPTIEAQIIKAAGAAIDE